MPLANPSSRTRSAQVTLQTALVLQEIKLSESTIYASVVTVNKLADGTEVGRGRLNWGDTDLPSPLSDLPQEVQDAVQVVKDYVFSQIP